MRIWSGSVTYPPFVVIAALVLGSIGAAPSPTPTPTPRLTPQVTPTPIRTPSPTLTTTIVSPTTTARYGSAPAVMPDLAVAPVRRLPVGSSPVVSRPWTPSPTLQAAVEAAVARHQGSISVVATNLDTGATASVNADQQLSSASLYKLFLLQSAYAKMSTSELSPQEKLTLRQDLADANPYTDLRVGTRSSVSCALQTMIEISSNSAADLIEDRLGDDAVNAYLLALGLQKSYITPDHAYTSAADIARLLDGIALGQAVNPLASSQMLTMLLEQQENNRLPLPLPVGIAIAHKTGELMNLRHDAGVIYAPSDAYLLVTLVANAPSEAAARDTIVDVSQTVYNAFGPAGVPRYLGLSPRLAADVFRAPDARGRLPVLLDPRTDSVAIGGLGVVQLHPDETVRLRQEVVPDLVAMQQAAAEVGFPFWVVSALQALNDTTARWVLPTAFVAPCAMDVPPPAPVTSTPPTATPTPALVPDEPTPTPSLTRTPAPLRFAPQAWLGTVIEVSDDPARQASPDDEPESLTVQWLEHNAWQFGFVPALPETDAGAAFGHEPWTFRWVGQAMAAQLQPLLESGDYAARAPAALRRAENELASQAQAHVPGALDAQVALWSR